jgi:hypothetical protein
MLHSANLAPKVLTGNGLTMTKAHSIGVRGAAVSSILWPKAHITVKQTLKNVGLHFAYQHLDDFKYIGESVNEDKSVIRGEESARSSIKGHYPAKDGIAACLLPAEAVDARGTDLVKCWGSSTAIDPVNTRSLRGSE